jgi:uncharacterized protein YbjT (DUF2867 family)
MTKPLILLTGANGRTGRAVTQALVEAGAEVRAFIRRADQEPALAPFGAVQFAVGHLGDADSLIRAAEGCQSVIHIGPPMDAEEVEQTQRVLAAAQKGGAGHFIYYSVMHPLRREVRHHRLKLDAEETVIESGLPYTIVQPIRYMQHLEPIWGQVTQDGVHAMPFSTERKFNLVDLVDLAEATAVVATQPGHLYATYELAGPESLSMNDCAAILTEELGRPVQAKMIPLETLKAGALARGLSEDRAQQMVTMNTHYDHFGFLGNPNVLTWLVGHAPSTFRAYVRRRIAQANG